jgi:aspartyl-tRNA(Asn)/glutamyl-tRNA(Gln) amidotransferase subunit C
MPNQDQKFSAEKVASLARIDLPENLVAQTQSQLDEILQFVDQLNELNLDGVEPFFGAADSNRPVRPDKAMESLPRKEVLANAPNHDDEFYLVPPVFGNQGGQ